MQRVSKTSSCWLWLGRVDKDGYGRLNIFINGKRVVLAHRASYLLHKGDIPELNDIDHTCFNRICVNPGHLETVPESINRSRQRASLKRYCKNGHEYTKENTYIRPNTGNRQRDCRICIRVRIKAHNERMKQEGKKYTRPKRALRRTSPGYDGDNGNQRKILLEVTVKNEPYTMQATKIAMALQAMLPEGSDMRIVDTLKEAS